MLQTLLPSLSIVISIAFCVYLLIRKRGGIAVFALLGGLVSCVSLEIFDLLALKFPEELLVWKKGALISESLLPSFWLLFALTFSRENGLRGLSALPRIALILSPVFVLAAVFPPVERFFYSPDFADERVLFLGQGGYFFYIAALLYFTFSLVHLECTLMSLPRHERWQVKFEIVGAGVLLAMFIFYYSQGLLYRSIDMNLVPIRAAALIAAVALMAYSRLRRGEAAKIYVSRDMAYRSVVVLVVGLYLIGLGLVGEGMRYLGESYQRSLFVAIAFLSGLAVTIILLSHTLKLKIRVFLHKHFYRNKFDYRTQWLRFTEELSASRNEQELQKAILSFFCRTFAVRGAALFLLEEESGEYRAIAWHDMRAEDLGFKEGNSLVQYLLEKKSWVFNIRDDNPQVLAENRTFLEKYGVSFIVPLYFDNNLEGFIVLGSLINESEAPTYEDYDLMKMVARQATSTLLSLKLSEQLSTAQEMAAIGKVSAFVMHDLKNLVSSLAMVVDNAKEYINDPDFQEDMFETLDGTVKKMKGLIAKLKNLEEKTVLSLQACDLKEVVCEVARTAHSGKVIVKGEPVFAEMDPGEIHKVVLNLVLNAQEAGGGNEPVTVEVGRDSEAFFRVSDKGCGMSEEFVRKRLFKPFETTKKKGFGIGLYQCKQVIEAHGGRIDVESREGVGSTFTVRLPLACSEQWAVISDE
jgi:putative PEP-CTERM system histidine kinase